MSLAVILASVSNARASITYYFGSIPYDGGNINGTITTDGSIVEPPGGNSILSAQFSYTDFTNPGGSFTVPNALPSPRLWITPGELGLYYNAFSDQPHEVTFGLSGTSLDGVTHELDFSIIGIAPINSFAYRVQNQVEIDGTPIWTLPDDVDSAQPPPPEYPPSFAFAFASPDSQGPFGPITPEPSGVIVWSLLGAMGLIASAWQRRRKAA